MKLKKFAVTDFRGVESFQIEPDGKDVDVYGANGTGKTTVADAFLWLLFGKDTADKKDFDLIPHVVGTNLPNVGEGKEPTVEATLEHEGETVHLKKIYAEEWPKKGEFKGQYTGSKTHYYVDDLEVKAGEYTSIISEMIDEKVFKLITNPQFFGAMLSWQERRAVLVNIAGELNVEPAGELKELMENRTFENYFLLSKQKVKEQRKALDGFPFQISEAKRMIPLELPPIADPDLPKAIAKLEEKLLAAKSNSTETAQRQQKAELELRLAEGKAKHVEEVEVGNEKIRKGIATLEAQLLEMRINLNVNEARVSKATYELETLNDTRTRLLEEYHATNDKIWTGSEICPTCNQALPQEEVESAKAAFNIARSTKLEQIKADGVNAKEAIGAKEAELITHVEKLAGIIKEVSTLETRINKGKSLLITPNYLETPEAKIVLDQILKLENRDQTDLLRPEPTEKIEEQIALFKSELEEQNRNRLIIEQASIVSKRIEELLKLEKLVNADLSLWEKSVHLCEEHLKRQSKLLEEAVNSKFKIAKFQMFATQKNGEEIEACDIVYPNGSTNLSTGERVQVGVDIINTLTEFYGVTAPIFIDNAESVTLPFATSSQVVKLFVSEKDSKLRVEVK